MYEPNQQSMTLILFAQQAVTSDMIARYQRVYGRKVFFLTGTDEHGQKVAATAEVRLCTYIYLPTYI